MSIIIGGLSILSGIGFLVAAVVMFYLNAENQY